MDFQKLTTIGHSQRNVQYNLLYLDKMCIYRFLLHSFYQAEHLLDIYYAQFSIVTLLVSFLSLFSRLCAFNGMQLAQYFVCWSLISFSLALVLHCRPIALLHMVVLYIYTSLFSPLNHSNHCFGIALTKALYSKKLLLHYFVLVVL